MAARRPTALLDPVERLLLAAARRHRIPFDDLEDFKQAALLHLLQSHVHLLHSQARVHLVWRRSMRVVLRSFAVTWLRGRLGRWRPSAAARARGKVALKLERLIARDGWSRSEAIETIYTQLRGSRSRQELDEIADALSLIPLPRQVSLEASFEPHASADDSALRVLPGDTPRITQRVESGLRTAFHTLPSLDQQILALKFGRQMTIGQVAAMLALPSERVQKRYQRLKMKLRRVLEAYAITSEEVMFVIRSDVLDLRLFEPIVTQLDHSAPTHGRSSSPGDSRFERERERERRCNPDWRSWSPRIRVTTPTAALRWRDACSGATE